MSSLTRSAGTRLSLGTMHAGQVAAYRALLTHRFKVLRCGRRFGKTQFAKMWIGQGLVQGQECAWFAPQHRTWSEVYPEMGNLLRPILDTSSKGSAVMRFITSGRLDFWTLENPIAGRGRRYHRVVIDEAAFAKDGDNKTDGSMMELWEKAIKPTLYVITHPNPPDRAAVRSCAEAARASRMTASAVRPARRPVATMEQRSA